MLRSNLATRPFYNERLVSLVIALVAVATVGLTIFNASRLAVLLRDRSGVQAHIRADHDEAARIASHAAALRKGIDRSTLARLTASAHEANDLIEQRTFSWSTLFARLEKTLPLDVRLVAVSPEVGQNVLRVSMSVAARELDDVATFIDNLTETGAFYDVQPTEQRLEDDNTYTALVVASYLPGRTDPAAPPAAPAAPARGTTNAAPAAPAARPARDIPNTGGRK